ncbi:DUF6211 family protein [Streptomyces sp. NPDC001108]
MVDDRGTTPGNQRPAPADTVFLRPGNPFGIDPRTPLIIANEEYGVYELNHQEHHPAYQDWAAAAELADFATIVRITADGITSSWTPAP